MAKDYMFDKNSFKTIVTNKEEAHQAVRYLSQNETNFRRELEQFGHSYEEENELVKTVWTNLLNSCKKVGYKDVTTNHKQKQYGIK